MIYQDQNIAFIPARANSKRLKNKNLLEFCGSPLISWTIRAALKSDCFKHVIVNTDCPRIAKVAVDYGAKVPFLRKPELAQDDSSTADVLRDFITEGRKLGFLDNLKTIALLQPTSPLRTAQDIKNAYQLMFRSDAKAVISVSEIGFPKGIINTLPDDLSMENFIDKKEILDHRILKKSYRVNGAIYLLSRDYFQSLEAIYSPESYAYIMCRENSVDIDTIEDFRYASFLASDCVSN